MRPVTHLMLVLFALLGACSMRSALETLTSPEDRAFAKEMVTRLRSGDQAWLQQHFRADLWEQSGKQLAQVPSLYPQGEAETELIGFNINTSTSGGVTVRNREFTLVTHGGGRWTVTNFRTYSEGGADQVVEWRVTPHEQPPPELTMIETWDAMVPWVWAGIVLVFGGVALLIFWLVRRSRRRRDPLMGQSGTP